VTHAQHVQTPLDGFVVGPTGGNRFRGPCLAAFADAAVASYDDSALDDENVVASAAG
jgi:hypothetical protein